MTDTLISQAESSLISEAEWRLHACRLDAAWYYQPPTPVMPCHGSTDWKVGTIKSYSHA